MGGQATWACLKYIPHSWSSSCNSSGELLVKSFPSDISNEVIIYNRKTTNGRFVLHTMLLGLLTGGTLRNETSVCCLNLTKEILFKIGAAGRPHEAQIRQQGTHETVIRDMIVGFGKWEFDPMELENLFPNKEGSVHLWQGDDDALVPVTLQRYVAKKLPWIHYHEIPEQGMFPLFPGMVDNIVKTLLTNEEVKN
ncbi:hypothetical protein HID58_094601 [Brassica napus]|uniref:Uncharacterized protein n=1 Tax=Brassica napus TaxID=3708 RepID=A0ABQ7X6R3_BRANA|nr:hypothetical protein HID58_094601 [Brassica napus]